MTRVGTEGVEALAAVIRRQVASLGKPAIANPPPVPASKPGKAIKKGRGGDLASIVARRVRAVDPSDPDAHAKAFKIFLESVLLAELGDHLINDPAFHQLVENVYGQMAGNRDLQTMMRDAAGILLGLGAS